MERAGNSVLLPVYEDTAPLFIIFILIASYSIYGRDVADCIIYLTGEILWFADDGNDSCDWRSDR